MIELFGYPKLTGCHLSLTWSISITWWIYAKNSIYQI